MPPIETQQFEAYVATVANAVVSAKFIPSVPESAPETTVRAALEKGMAALDAGFLANAVAKTTPVDADRFVIGDSEDSGILKRISWLAVKTAIKAFLADFLTPTGAMITMTSNSAPSGYLKANGASVSRATYAALWAFAQASGNLALTQGSKTAGQYGPGDGATTFTIPDLRGEFVRGWDDGRGVDSGRNFASDQADDLKAHTHTGSAVSGGAHTHSGSTNSAGAHTHGVDIATGPSGMGGFPVEFNPAGTQYPTSSAGAHSHTVTIDSGGAHSHTLSINNTGGAETRPRNIALLRCIKV